MMDAYANTPMAIRAFTITGHGFDPFAVHFPPTPTPTITPTACGESAQGESLCPPATPTATATATPTETPTTPTYQIQFGHEDDLNEWTTEELEAIHSAVQYLGEAFQIQLNAASPQEAFNRVMTIGADPQYVYFFKGNGSSSAVTITYPSDLNKPPHLRTVNVGGCFTVNNNGLPRTVVCNWSSGNSALYPTHAMVHELGHVFTNRSIVADSSHAGERDRGLLYAAIDGTFSGECSPAFGASAVPDPFQDMAFAVSRCNSINDLRGIRGLVMGIDDEQEIWRRGERGWGSGPDNVFTPFQQHPLDLFLGDDNTTRVDETAADMFLNWVYRRRTNNPPAYQAMVPGTWEGFRNMSWLNNQAGANDDNYPGDARFEWMNRVMNRIFSLKGW